MASLLLKEPGATTRRLEIDGDVVTVGRDQSNDIVVPTSQVSAVHAELRFSQERGGYLLRDLGSHNGTWINGEIADETLLCDGDVVYFADVPSVFTESFLHCPPTAEPAGRPDGAAGVRDRPRKQAAGDRPAAARAGKNGTRAERVKTAVVNTRPRRRSRVVSVPPIIILHPRADEGMIFPIEKGVVTLGRHPDSDIFVENPWISERHAEFRHDPGSRTWQVVDLGSHNGTKLNGDRIERAALNDGDTIEFGHLVCLFRCPGGGEADATPVNGSGEPASDAAVTPAGGADRSGIPPKRGALRSLVSHGDKGGEPVATDGPAGTARAGGKGAPPDRPAAPAAAGSGGETGSGGGDTPPQPATSERARSALTGLKAEIESRRQEVRSVMSDLAASSETLRKLEQERAASEALNRSIIEQRKILERAKADSEALAARRTELSTANEELQRRRKELELVKRELAGLSGERDSAAKAREAEAREKQTRLLKELEKLTRRNQELQQAHDVAEVKLKEFAQSSDADQRERERTIRSLRGEAEKAKSKVHELESALAEAAAKAKKIEERAAAQKAAGDAAAQERAGVLKRTITEHETRLRAVKSDHKRVAESVERMERAASRLASTQHELASITSELEARRAHLAETEERVHSKVTEREAAEAKLARTLKALGEANQAMADADEKRKLLEQRNHALLEQERLLAAKVAEAARTGRAKPEQEASPGKPEQPKPSVASKIFSALRRSEPEPAPAPSPAKPSTGVARPAGGKPTGKPAPDQGAARPATTGDERERREPALPRPSAPVAPGAMRAVEVCSAELLGLQRQLKETSDRLWELKPGPDSPEQVRAEAAALVKEESRLIEALRQKRWEMAALEAGGKPGPGSGPGSRVP